MRNKRSNRFFWWHLFNTSMKASLYHRKSAFLEIALMFISRFWLLAIWLIFFNHYSDIKGWGLQDVVILLAIMAGAYGCMQIFFGGMYNIPRMIINGDLDSFLVQPRNVLFHIMGSKSLTRGWGDILYIFILMAFAGTVTPKVVALLLVGIICSCAIAVSANIIVMSLGFWLGGMENLVQKYYTTLLVFCSYPTNIYSGFLKIVLFTVIPAGAMGFLPVELVRNFSWIKLFTLISVSAVFVLLASLMFSRGLRRYASGCFFGVRW